MTISVDLFAGMGGFTAGAEAAGCSVVWAANHWPEAVAVHAANHPRTAHACQDLHQMDWAQVPAHDLLTASPACQGHAHARGRERPGHDTARSTAWAVVSALEAGRASVALVENVPEFRKWALYPAWREALRLLGYAVAEHIIDAADHGVPQHRRRLFLVLSRSQAPLVLRLPRREHVGAGNFLNFEAGTWAPVHQPGRAAATLARYEMGRRVHGDRFLLPYYGTARGGRSLSKPIGTITTSANHHAVIDGARMRMLLASEVCAAMGFPKGYKIPERRTLACHMLGNAVCPPVATALIQAVREAA